MPFFNCPSVACNFDKAITLPIAVFEIFVLVLALIIVPIIMRVDKKALSKFGTLLIGVFIFEFFTSPMWNNFHMGSWAYVYRDVSWILTVGWAVMIFFIVTVVDRLIPKVKEWRRFLIYLLLLTSVATLFESLLVGIEVRSYSPEVLGVVGRYFIPYLGIPWHVFYYMPVFLSLIIGFYKYFGFAIDKKPLVPVNKSKLFRNFIIALAGVFLFELMIEPMVSNANFPRWSYIYRDISFIMSISWVLLVWIATTLIDKYLIQAKLLERFFGYIAIVGAIALPVEAWLINHGFRIYLKSAADNFSGFAVPYFGIPMEVALAIPFYFALIIGFLRYWETILDNKL